MATALLVAAKVNDDTFYSNSFYAKVAGVNLREFNIMEDSL